MKRIFAAAIAFLLIYFCVVGGHYFTGLLNSRPGDGIWLTSGYFFGAATCVVTGTIATLFVFFTISSWSENR